MTFLHSAVDDTHGRRVVARCHGRRCPLGCRPAFVGVLRERDVLGLDNFKNVRVVEGQILETDPPDLHAETEAASADHFRPEVLRYALAETLPPRVTLDNLLEAASEFDWSRQAQSLGLERVAATA
ncbi:MAG: hypothetical protein ACTS22_01830 [Phycisphaerales bacterium]